MATNRFSRQEDGNSLALFLSELFQFFVKIMKNKDNHAKKVKDTILYFFAVKVLLFFLFSLYLFIL